MKKSLLLIVAAFIMLPFANASHVVGGDFQINMTSQVAGGANYHVKLRIYRDDVNGIAMPASITCNFFQVGTNTAIGGNITLTQTSLGLVTLGDPCYTPDPNVVRIEEGIFETSIDVFIPDFAAGYYVSASLNARNSLAINVQAGGTMTWFAMIPDPALGQNSTPDFGNYPADAYFCIAGPKAFQYPITDVDGDSLAYSLVEPMSSAATTVAPGAGAYPYYPSLNWAAGYNMGNIVGGAPNMFINQLTGLITAAPTALGFFTFAIRVEEFRDTNNDGIKDKIGEVRRDVQYISLNCTGGIPATFLNSDPINGGTLQFPYNKLSCKDLVFADANPTDTVFMSVISPIFDSGAYLPVLVPDLNGDFTFYYDLISAGPPAIWNDSVVIPASLDTTVIVGNDTTLAQWNIGTIATRFCWTPGCDEIGQTFPFQVNTFSVGCDGLTLDSIAFFIEVTPPVFDLKNPGIKETPFGSEYCRNIVFHDTTIVDMLNITITSDIFNEGAEYPALDNNYNYDNWVYLSGYPSNNFSTGVANGANNNTGVVATRFCWTPDCEHIGKTYSVQAVLSSVDCPDAIQDTINFEYLVTPPFDSLGVVPNVITPNGDGLNDVYKISGISNPCHDEIKVEIYNRWGLLIYESSEYPEFEWDGTNKSGTKVPAGTYFVLVSGTYGNETVTLDQRSVTVLDP
ncbi:MAG: gliding motility-associated C-terminal domain-containing protein, partial [Flavobacteriales bacterium]|nr:gliding motility-associated C-terminal domain-containing protein [Flavobacteriales bacterium]